MVLITKVSTLIDGWSRLTTVRWGIVSQTLGVVVSTVAIYALSLQGDSALTLNLQSLLVFSVLLAAGVIASLGATVMDIAVVQDWLPIVAPSDHLAVLNSQFKRVDLATELGAPVLAGLILARSSPSLPLLGFYIVGAWNLVSFIPEFALLKKIYRSEGKLSDERTRTLKIQGEGLFQRLKMVWSDFIAQPVALPMLAYAMLWVTILSPHGVILGAYLKAQWGLSETAIGIFRGLGAVFGLAATVVFPRVISKLGLVRASRHFIVFEAACLVAAGIFFSLGAQYFLFFAAFLLLSRIGLYGFSLGEIEIRQRMVEPEVKGKVNGTASALTSLATLFVYGAGALLSGPESFSILIYGSILFVALGAVTFWWWSTTKGRLSDLAR
jgi:iron-regulated transporter 1